MVDICAGNVSILLSLYFLLTKGSLNLVKIKGQRDVEVLNGSLEAFSQEMVELKGIDPVTGMAENVS